MQPVVTPAEMAAIDDAAPDPVEVLVGRAGAAVARSALRLLGGSYGRRVVVVAGKGNNGADGRHAADRLARRGVRVAVIDAATAPVTLPSADLVIDAAYGTGFRGSYEAPALPAGGRTAVLAVDIPSGVSGLTGEASGRPLRADATVSFAAWKPGLLLGDGPGLAGAVEVVDIGLDTSSARAHRVEAADVARWLPARPHDSHKWKAAVWLVAGSPAMTGAAHLATRAALRAGAGYARLSSPGVDDDAGRPTESVGWPLPATGWGPALADDLDRFDSVVVGPGLGTGTTTGDDVRALVGSAGVAMVVDGDGIGALGADAAGVIAQRPAGSPLVVLTPHDGEYARLTGARPTADRLDAARSLASAAGAVVLLKGSTTVVAEPSGSVLLTDTGDARLATAGTGDVLSGILGGLLARGVEPFHAAAAAAWLHGSAARLGPATGLIASDLPELVPQVLGALPAPVGE